MNYPMTSVKNAEGVPFNVRLLPAGGKYGLSGKLVADKPMVEFYDARYHHTGHGQFIARYYVSTLLEFSGALQARTGGLVLNASVPGWTLDSAALIHVLEWLASAG